MSMEETLAKKYAMRKYFKHDKEFKDVVWDYNLDGLKQEYREFDDSVVVAMIINDVMSNMDMLTEHLKLLRRDR